VSAAAPRWAGGRAGLVVSAAVVLALVVLEAGLAPRATAQRTSDVLQLLLATAAGASCFVTAAAAGGGRSRPLWSALGLGCLSWACGQVVWVVRGAPLGVEDNYAVADFLFAVSTALFLVAFVIRRDRGGARRLTLAIDVTVVVLAMLYVFCELALAHVLAGDAVSYDVWSRFLFDFRGLALLPVILWSLRVATASQRPLYAELAPAFVLLQLGGLVTNESFEAGIAVPYHPGIYDLAWTLPFVWIGLVAANRRTLPEPPAPDDRPPAGSWSRTRRATVLAFVTVLLFPVLHVVVAWGDPPGSPLASWRAGIALLGTLLVAVLYLVRQLYLLRESERSLREGEERYRVLLDSSADTVGVYGVDLRVLYVSGGLRAMSGVRPEERIGRNALELAHPDDAGRIKAVVALLLEKPGELVRTTFRARTEDGRWSELEVDAVNRLDEPAVRGIVANFRDVSEVRRAEHERERSLSLLEATLESTADGILVVDRSGHVVRFNQKLAAMWRLPQDVWADRDIDEALDYVFDELEHPESCRDALKQLYAQPEVESFDTLRFKDGRVFERYSLPQRLGGVVIGRVFSYRDVTQRVRTEEAMARLVAIIEATPDFVATCDASLTPLYLNRAGRRMLGLEGGQPLGQRHVGEFHPEPDATRLLEEAIPAALQEGAWSGESRLRRADGREIPVLQVVLAHRSQDGAVDFLSMIARDISQRIEAERELRRSHTMAALGSLVAGVAHEVRNPLFGISSTLDAFDARFGRQEAYGSYVQALREQLGQLTTLMNDLLEYATPTRLELARGRFEDVVARALSAVASLQQRVRVGIDTRLASDLPALRMDERRLTLVVRNLLENAMQHAGAPGRVSLEVLLVRDKGGAWLECRVEDDGPGIAPEDLPHVFEPFFTRRQGGTGLGLAIVQRIVDDHGGSVAACNREGGGARLTVSLPA
jgi:PAS domain S-box-containing protein